MWDLTQLYGQPKLFTRNIKILFTHLHHSFVAWCNQAGTVRKVVKDSTTTSKQKEGNFCTVEVSFFFLTEQTLPHYSSFSVCPVTFSDSLPFSTCSSDRVNGLSIPLESCL